MGSQLDIVGVGFWQFSQFFLYTVFHGDTPTVTQQRLGGNNTVIPSWLNIAKVGPSMLSGR